MFGAPLGSETVQQRTDSRLNTSEAVGFCGLYESNQGDAADRNGEIALPHTSRAVMLIVYFTKVQ